MENWRDRAAKGQWSMVGLREIMFLPSKAQEREIADLREALGVAIPTMTIETGFEDRTVRAEGPRDLLRAVRTGTCRRTMKEISHILGRKVPAAPTAAETQGRLLRLAGRYSDRLGEKVTPEEARALDQAGHAVRLLGGLDAMADDGDDGVDDDLEESEAVALGVLSEKGIALSAGEPASPVDMSVLGRVIVRPLPGRAGSVPDIEGQGWESDLLPERSIEVDVFVTGGDEYDTVERQGIDSDPVLSPDQERDGWVLLTDLASPSSAYFDTALGHAVAVLCLVSRARDSIALIDHPGPYRPGKKTTRRHMSEHRRIAREIARHLQAILDSPYVHPVRRHRKSRENLRKNNPNPSGQVKPETRTVLAAMKHFVRRGHSVSVAAKKVAQMKEVQRHPDAIRRLWYDYRNGKIFNEIIPMTEDEVKRREVSARNP